MNSWSFLMSDLGHFAPVLIDAAVKGAVVLAAAWVATACMRRCSAAARHLVWCLAIAGLLLLPLLCWALPGWHVLPHWMAAQRPRIETIQTSAPQPQAQLRAVEVPPPMRPFRAAERESVIRLLATDNPMSRERSGTTGPTAAPGDTAPIVVAPTAPRTTSPGRTSFSIGKLASLVWILGASLALLPTAGGMLSLWHLERGSRRQTSPVWLDLLRALLSCLSLRRPVRLLKSARRRIPMTWGVWRTRVLLPEESEAWTAERRRVVLLHELAHAKRWDYLTQLAAQLARALYWFNPLVWLAGRRMVIERERACDDIVLRQGATPANYAEQVLAIAAGLPVGSVTAYGAVGMVRRSSLEGRLRAILDGKHSRASVTRLATALSLALLSVVVVPVAMMRAAPGPSGQPAPASPSVATQTNVNAASDLPPPERRVSLSAQAMSFKDALVAVCRAAKVELEIDEEGLKMAGMPADVPVTVSFKDERLDEALPRILNAAQGREFHGIYREMRDNKVFVSSLTAMQARMQRDLPDWLKLLYNRGLVANLDEDRNVISLSVGEKADDDFMAKLKTLPKLRELDIEVTKGLTATGLVHLAELPALEKLHLYHVYYEDAELGNEAIRAVAGIKTLRDLSVAECGVTDDGLRPLEGMTQLTSLRLSGNLLTDAGMKSLAGLTNLQSLDISSSGWVRSNMQITDEGIKELSALTKLRTFSVYGLKVSGTNAALPHIQTMDLSGDQVTDATLDSVILCRELQTLRLTYTAVTDEGLKKLASLKELRRLTLDSRVITDDGIAYLKALPKLDQVELRATGISDEALGHLAEIKTLTRLDIHGSGQPGVNWGRLITLQGLLQLKNLPELRTLWINNMESPTGFMGLRALTQLRSLVMNFCNVNEAEEELLQTAMPGTSVSVVSGRDMRIGARAERGPLPTTSVSLAGRVVDDSTGSAIDKVTLEFGIADLARPGDVVWGQALPGPSMEVSGNDPRNSSQFWGECFRTSQVSARILAAGYAPALVTPQPLLAPLRLTNLVVRMKPGGDLHGVVLAHDGRPLPGLKVYLLDGSYFSLRDGVPASSSKSGSAITDAAGRFALPGGNGTGQRVVVASTDGQMFRAVPGVDPAHEVKISMPAPASLAVRYDIPEDLPVAQLFVNFEPSQADRAVWTSLGVGLGTTVENRNELVLTNLAPGNWRVSRRKVLSVSSGGRGDRSRNQRIVWLDESTLDLVSGQIQHVEMVRPAGQRIRGEVGGLAQTSALGAYVYAYSSRVTNSPANPYRSQRPLDGTTSGLDGVFQTAGLDPDRYLVVAMVFKEPNIVGHSGSADYIGTAKVTVTADAPPPPVKIELRPSNKVIAELIPALSDGNLSSRVEATNSLRQIDPMEAERAGVRWEFR
jgi:beta-lactamase regulating signal transducer with metallopeptidase domain/Leucine-rich repeat (LRR) protein